MSRYPEYFAGVLAGAVCLAGSLSFSGAALAAPRRSWAGDSAARATDAGGITGDRGRLERAELVPGPTAFEPAQRGGEDDFQILDVAGVDLLELREPVVEDGVMYVPDGWGTVYAIDVSSGKKASFRWKMDPKTDKAWAGDVACCGVNNRGVALWKDKVISVTLDGRLIATNKATGEIAWERRIAVSGKCAQFAGFDLRHCGWVVGQYRGYMFAQQRVHGRSAARKRNVSHTDVGGSLEHLRHNVWTSDDEALEVSNRVLPSGAERATASAPIAVPAPGRFSTIIVTGRIRPICSATTRAKISVPPPGWNGTTILMVLVV
jgi:hypothetical protein